MWGKTAKLILKWINRSGSIRLYFILFPLLLFFDASTEPSESAEGPGGAAGPAGGPPEADGGWDPGRSSSSRFKFTVLMSCPWCVSGTCVYWTNVYGFNYLICVPSPPPYPSSGRQSPHLSLPEGFSGRVHRCSAPVVGSARCGCRNVYRDLRSTKLRRSKHRKHRQRLHQQPEEPTEVRLERWRDRYFFTALRDPEKTGFKRQNSFKSTTELVVT